MTNQEIVADINRHLKLAQDARRYCIQFAEQAKENDRGTIVYLVELQLANLDGRINAYKQCLDIVAGNRDESDV